MKKIIAAVVLAALLVTAPWLTGRIARNRIDHAFESVPRKVPYLKIVESKWTSSWFSSEHLTTFEIVLPQLNPAVPVADTGKRLPQPVAEPAAEEIPNAPLSSPMLPLRFSLRDHMQHGPILGTVDLGLARLQSELVLSDEVRKKVVDLFGTAEPLQVVTKLGFLGGTSATVSARGRSVDLGKLDAKLAGGSIAWDDFKLSFHAGRHASSYQFDGRVPRIEVRHDKSGVHALVTDITLRGNGHRIAEDLYDGDASFGIGKLAITGKDNASVEIEAVKYDFDADKKGDFLDYAFRFGSGEIRSKQLEPIGVQLQEVHFDYTLRHLHIDTLQKLMAGVRAAQARVYAGSATSADALAQPLKEQGIELIKHDPGISIDRVGIVTPQGNALIKGTIKAEGITDADLAAGTAGATELLQKLICDFNIEIAQALVDKIPNGATMTRAGIDNGYLKRDGDKLVSHIEWRHGALLVNGKAPRMPQGLQLPDMPPPAAPTK